MKDDWNAEFGLDAYSLCVRRGQQKRDIFACGYSVFTIANTSFSHKVFRQVTWVSPMEAVKNQKDFISLSRRFHSSIAKAGTGTFPDAHIGSDHKLVLSSLRMIPSTKRTDTKHTHPVKLQKPLEPWSRGCLVFRVAVGGRFSALDLLDSICNLDFLSSHDKEVLGFSDDKVMEKKKPRKGTWITKKVLNFCKLCKRFQRQESAKWFQEELP